MRGSSLSETTCPVVPSFLPSLLLLIIKKQEKTVAVSTVESGTTAQLGEAQDSAAPWVSSTS